MISLHQDPDFDLAYGVFVIEFYARWCGTCRNVTKYLCELEKEMGFQGVLVDIESSPLVSKNFCIQGVPIIVITNDGVEIGRIGGSLTKAEIRQWILDNNAI
ncbi:MAG: thioredoxin family protein [Candidatus Izemoplasmatales bacterium]|jgi:thioredoxin-like negative regulator of GroEL